MTSSVSPPPLTPARLSVLLHAIGEQCGLPTGDAQPIRFVNNAVFAFPRAHVVVRIAGSQTVRNRVPNVIAAARWLARHDFPAVRLLEEVAQPVLVDGHVATLWHQVPLADAGLSKAFGRGDEGAELGRMLRRLHSLPYDDLELSAWDPLKAVHSRVAEETAGLTSAEKDALLVCCETVERTLPGLPYMLPAGPIHGDPLLSNTILGPEGLVLCDLDGFCHGPREWDLTPAAVGILRFDYPGDTHTPLSQAYGFNVMDWPGFSVLRQVRELNLITSVLPVLASKPSLQPEWRRRFESFMAGDREQLWRPYI